MEIPLVVALEPLVSDGCNRELLMKRIPREYLNNTFRNVIMELLNTEADEYGAVYNCEERHVAERIQCWFDIMDADPLNVVRIAAVPNEKEHEAMRVSLDDKISDYTGRILQTRTFSGEDGKGEIYHLIDLYICFYPGNRG